MYQPAATRPWHDYIGEPTLADAICDRLLCSTASGRAPRARRSENAVYVA